MPDGNDLALGASSALPGNNPEQAQLVASLIQSSGHSGMPVQGGQGESPIVFGPQANQPRPPVQYKPPEGAFQIPQGNFGSTGERKRAERQSLFGSIASLVKSGTDYIQAKKSRALEMDIERLMSAYEGMNEAKASGDKDALAKNQEIINDITKDPKKAKLIAKAFNIDLLGNGKNKAENQALYSAYKGYQEKQQKGESGLNPNAQRITGSMPQRSQINPALLAQAQMIKANLIPGAKESMEEAGKNLRAYTSAQTAKDKMAATSKIADDLIKAKKYGADKQFEASLQRSVTLEDNAKIHAEAQIKVENTRAQAMLEATQKRVDAMAKISKDKQGNKIFDEVFKEQNEFLKKIQDNNKKIKDLSKTLQDQPGMFASLMPGAKKSKLSSDAILQLKMDIMTAHSQNTGLEAEFKSSQQKLALMTRMGAMPGFEPNAGGDSSGSGGEVNVSPDDMKSGGDMNINLDLSSGGGDGDK